jgi:hypothetical protein
MSATEAREFRTRQARIVFVGSIVSSLVISVLRALAALRQPLLSHVDGSVLRRVRFYFSLYFNDKPNWRACDVQFVPNVDQAT